MHAHHTEKPETALESWKEIAAYLNRDARTVRRWEKSEALPVRRHRHLARSSVYAFPSELDAWRAGRRPAVPEAVTARWPILRLGPAAGLFMVTALALGGGRFLAPVSVSAQEPQLRRVWVGDRETTMLRDGREISYDTNQNLIVRSRDGRIVTLSSKEVQTSDHTAGWRLSPDERQVAFSWYREATNRYELRLATVTDGRGDGGRVILDNPDVNIATPLDWSPDGQSLAVELSRKDRTRQLALVSVRDGSVRVLKTSGWDHEVAAAFSPDGRLLAVNHDEDAAILTLDDLRLSMVAEGPSREHVVGWSPDGRFIVVTSDRRGTTDVFVVPVADDRAAGEPQLVFRELGDKRPLEVTDAGVVRLQASASDTDVVIRSLDLERGAIGQGVVPPRRRRLGSNDHPDWSADGRSLAYVSSRPSGGAAVVIEDAETGESQREVPMPLGYPGWLRWSPSGQAFVMSGTDSRGRIGVFLLELPTGRTRAISMPRDDFWRGFRPEWSADGGRIYYTVPEEGGTAVVEHDVASGAERRVLQRQGRVALAPSPDARWIAVTTDERRGLQLLSPDGTWARDLIGSQPDRTLASFLAWTPDSSGVLVLEEPAEGTAGPPVWYASLAGGPRRLAGAGISGPFRVHPDGLRLVGTRQTERHEVWVLENLLPPGR